MSVRRPLHFAVPLLAMAGLWAGAGGSRAEMPSPAEGQQILQKRLDALGQHFHGGSLARWSNPDDQKALQDVWDPTFIGRPPYSAADVPSLVGLLKAQTSVLQNYTTAGHAIPGSAKEARVRTKYQDEIVRGSASLAATSAALLQAMGSFADKLKPAQLNAERRQSIAEGRSGVRSLIESFFTELQLPEVTPANKVLLLDALAANAETISVYSPDEDRRRYARAATAVLPSLPEADKAKLQAFIAATETKKCEGLCALKG